MKRSNELVPSLELKREVASKFWSMIGSIQRVVAGAPDADWESAKRELRGILGPWLWRSEHFNRAFHKPHGFAADYVTLEMIYALESGAGDDPMRPALVNCLDYVFATLQAVQGLWERRARLTSLLHHESVRRGGRLSILDVGSGSAPYLRDFLCATSDTSEIEVTLLDQDPTAIHFLRARSFARWDARLRTYTMAMRHLPAELVCASYDVVIAAGVFDECDDELARETTDRLVDLAKPGGLVALSAFHPAEPSRLVREWILDWPFETRDDVALADLFPAGLQVAAERSSNGALCYAFGQI